MFLNFGFQLYLCERRRSRMRAKDTASIPNAMEGSYNKAVIRELRNKLRRFNLKRLNLNF